MLRSSGKSFGSALLSVTLVAGMLAAGLVSGCSPATTLFGDQPEAAPQEGAAGDSTATPETEAALQEDSVAASTVASSEIEKRPREPVETLLEGRISGVRAWVDSHGNLIVRIRGATSFYGSAEPLYVIDGTPIGGGHGGRLAGLTPYDIESIEVLKGPPETTLYGVRGANGVVLITTRRP